LGLNFRSTRRPGIASGTYSFTRNAGCIGIVTRRGGGVFQLVASEDAHDALARLDHALFAEHLRAGNAGRAGRLAAQAVGADDRVGVARGVQRGIVLAIGLSLAAMVLLLLAGPLLTMARQPVEVVPIAHRYARGLIPGVFAFYLFTVLRQSLQAMGRVRPIVLTVLVANLVNVALNWAFIFGNAGAPA